MKLHLTRMAAWLLLPGLCGPITSAYAAPPSAVGPLGSEPATAAAIPRLTVTTLAGAPFSLAAQRGKWVIVNFWATWCSPCIKEMPALSAFVATRCDVTAIGLAYEDQPASVLRAFLRKHPVRYAIAQVDPAHPPAGIAMPEVLPTTLLVAPDGRIARTFIGPLDLKQLAAVIGKPGAGQ